MKKYPNVIKITDNGSKTTYNDIHQFIEEQREIEDKIMFYNINGYPDIKVNIFKRVFMKVFNIIK